MEQLYRYHASHSPSSILVPTINHRQLDLWLLRKEVYKLDGFAAVRRSFHLMDLFLNDLIGEQGEQMERGCAEYGILSHPGRGLPAENDVPTDYYTV